LHYFKVRFREEADFFVENRPLKTMCWRRKNVHVLVFGIVFVQNSVRGCVEFSFFAKNDDTP